MVAVSLYLCLAVFCLVLAYLRFVFRLRREGEPPYVPGHLVWGNAADFAKHAVRFLHKSRQSLGDIFTIRLFNQYLTIIMDPHCFESITKEKNFDFDPIQKQVNNNVFNFQLKEARKMISEAGKKVNGRYLSVGIDNFARNLDMAFQQLQSSLASTTHRADKQWRKSGLRSLTAKTLFNAQFYTIFGRAGGVPEDDMFTPEKFHENFDIFHKFFNFLWLGFPVGLFPKACQAMRVLCQQPLAHDMMNREGVSDYIKFSTEYMLRNGQTSTDIVGHNLVFLHVNYNTFRVTYWCVYHLLELPHVRHALLQELKEAIEQRRSEDDDKASFTMEEFDKLPLLDSFLKETLRVSSGVFMVRKVVEDTQFTMPSGHTYTIRKGDRVAMYPPAIHMDGEIFENPEVFKYDRFVDAKFYKHGQELKYPLIGFGSLCPGRRISMLQIKWYLMNILNSFSMELLEGERTELNTQYYGHEILPPVNDVQVQYRYKPDAPQLVFVPRRSSS